jgi:hypothetical protein
MLPLHARAEHRFENQRDRHNISPARVPRACCSSGASVSRLNSATLACEHERRSAPHVREMTAGAPELHGDAAVLNAPRPFHDGEEPCPRHAQVRERVAFRRSLIRQGHG